jgi:hypothetical protein
MLTVRPPCVSPGTRDWVTYRDGGTGLGWQRILKLISSMRRPPEQRGEEIGKAIRQRMYTGVYSGDVAEVRQLLVDHPGLLTLEVIERTWLHHAARRDNVAMVELLVEAGLDVNTPCNDRNSEGPLSDAARKGCVEVAQWLLEHGAKVGVGDGKYWTPLSSAAVSGSLEMVRLLLEHGADVHTSFGFPPEKPRMPRRGDMAELLRSYGATEPGVEPSGNLVATEINHTELQKEVVSAARQAFSYVRQQHPDETFYVFGLSTDSDVSTIGPVSNSTEGLQRLGQKYNEPGLPPWLRWSPDEWEYEDAGGQYFDKARDTANALYECDSDEEFVASKRRRLDTFAAALEELDAEGFFGDGEERQGVTLLLHITDPSDFEEEWVQEYVKALNPESVYQSYVESHKCTNGV